MRETPYMGMGEYGRHQCDGDRVTSLAQAEGINVFVHIA